MKFFINLATDRYGALCLGRLQQLLDEVGDRSRERHFFAWAGPGEAPRAESYWDQRYPHWDQELSVPYDEEAHGPLGLDLDRQALADAVSDAVMSSALRSELDELGTDRPRRELANHQKFETAMTVIGSLADPGTSAIVLGLLSGLARRRHLDPRVAPAHCVLATDSLSGHMDDDEEKLHALVSRSLLDLELFFTDAAVPFERAAQVVLVGPGSSATPHNLDTQVALGSMALLGLGRSIVIEHSQLRREEFNPFLFEVDAGLTARCAHGEFDPARPFVLLGAYAVYCPATRLARLLATRICRLVFTLLAAQEGQASLDDCSRIELPEAVDAFIGTVEGRAIKRTWDAIAGESIPWEKDGSDPDPVQGWFDLGRIELLFQEVFTNPDWQRLIDCYTEDRLRALPLEDWSAALDELEQAIETAVMPRRKRQITQIERRVLLAMLEGIDAAVGEVFERAFHRPVGSNPHRVAQALLGRIKSHVRKRREQLQAQGIISGLRGKPRSTHRPRLGRLRTKLTEALSAVPSPAAVMLRILPMIALGVGLGATLPIDLGALEGPVFRLAAGGAFGLLGAVVLFWAQVEQVRRVLMADFRAWFSQYRAILQEEDELLRRSAFAELLGAMEDCLDWYFCGTEDRPPLPEALRIRVEEADEPPPPEEDQELLRGQEALSSFKTHLEGAAEHFAELEQKLSKGFQISLLETVLPEIRPDRPQVFESELENLLGTTDPGDADDGSGPLSLFLQSLEDGAVDGTLADETLLVPYRAAPNPGPATTPPLWRRTFAMPSGTELLDAEVRDRSSAFRFMSCVEQFIASKFEDRFSLPNRVRAYQETSGARTLSDTPLARAYANDSVPSLEARRGQLAHFVISAGTGDRLAPESDWNNDLGAGHLTMHLQLKVFVTAEEIIYYPNEEAPTTPLGRAWKTCVRSSWPHRALTEVRMPPEERA